MPEAEHDPVDERIATALRETAREPDASGDVLDAVQHKHWARQVRRRAGAVGFGLVAALAVAGFASLVASDDGGGGGGDTRVEIATDVGTGPATRGSCETISVDVANPGFPLREVPLEGDPYVRGPIAAIGDAVWVATYNRTDGGYTFPPSHLVDVRSGNIVQLKGEIQSLAVGDGALWAVTHDKVRDPDGTEYRIKRIGPDAEPHSQAIPPELGAPAGDVVVGRGMAWVPMSNGVARFDGETGELVDEIALDTEFARYVAVTDVAAFASEGPGIARIDGDEAVEIEGRYPPSLGASPQRIWATDGLELTRYGPDLEDPETSGPFSGMANAKVQPTADGAVVTGRDVTSTETLVAKRFNADLSPNCTVMVTGSEDMSVAFAGHRAYVAGNGTLYQIRLR